MAEKERPGLIVMEEPGGMLRKRLMDYDGTILVDETILPHDDLVRFMHKPLGEYSRRLEILEEHPLFEESIDISILDFRDLVKQCFEIAYDLQTDFPETYFLTRIQLEDLVASKDDGSASILLEAGNRMRQAVRTLYLTRVRMRNIMEICFSTTDGMTQQQRWERMITTYPELGAHEFTVHWRPEGNRWVREHEMRSLMELYFFEVCAALRSDKRIVRCQHCWQYFVPRTKKKTDYCDRVWSDGTTCKQRGPNLKRKDGPAEDLYLLAFKKLRARFYEREYRDYASLPGMDVPGGSYDDWIEDAHTARMEYLEGRISGEELLRRINPEGEEIGLDDSFPDRPPYRTAEEMLFQPWEQLVERNISFDPNQHFKNIQILDLREDNPAWRIITAEEQESKAKQGKESLMEKYKK